MQVTNRPSIIRQQASGNASSTNKSSLRSVNGQNDGAKFKAVNNGTGESKEQQQAMSGGSSFSDPMEDADTLMRAILANKPGKAEPKNENTPEEQKALDKVVDKMQARFADNASNKEAFHELMQKSFGDKYDKAEAEEIRQKSLDGDFSWMPEVKLVDAETLTSTSGPNAGATASGAYSKDDDTIFLSRELLADPEKAEKVLTEEVGHALDARINTSDAAGDEGNIFARLSYGENISASELTELRSENDSGTIMVDGREVEVEFFIGKALKKIGKAIKKGVKKVGKAITGTRLRRALRK